jgi:hypothetical protein
LSSLGFCAPKKNYVMLALYSGEMGAIENHLLITLGTQDTYLGQIQGKPKTML